MSNRIEEAGTKALNKKIYRMQAEICRVLSDPTRIEILDTLKEGEQTVGELVNATGLRQANVSQHLALLRQSGLVSTRRQGTTIYYSLATSAIVEACSITRRLVIERIAEHQDIISSVMEEEESLKA
jgi:ArsR family transcriptional regulator